MGTVKGGNKSSLIQNSSYEVKQIESPRRVNGKPISGLLITRRLLRVSRMYGTCVYVCVRVVDELHYIFERATVRFRENSRTSHVRFGIQQPFVPIKNNCSGA